MAERKSGREKRSLAGSRAEHAEVRWGTTCAGRSWVEHRHLRRVLALGATGCSVLLCSTALALPTPNRVLTESGDSYPPSNVEAADRSPQVDDERGSSSPPKAEAMETDRRFEDMQAARPPHDAKFIGERKRGVERPQHSTDGGVACRPKPASCDDAHRPTPPPAVCCCQTAQAPDVGSSGAAETFGREVLVILAPLGILLKGWEVSTLSLKTRGEIGGTGVAGGIHVPLLGPMQDFGPVGGFTAYAGGGGNGQRGGRLGATQLRLGLGIRSESAVFAVQGVGGVNGWREQIPESAEGGTEFEARWMVGEWGPALSVFVRPTWVTNHERRNASRLEGVHELTVGMRVSVSREIPIAARIAYQETMGTQMVVVGFGSGVLDWIVDYEREP